MNTPTPTYYYTTYDVLHGYIMYRNTRAHTVAKKTTLTGPHKHSPTTSQQQTNKQTVHMRGIISKAPSPVKNKLYMYVADVLLYNSYTHAHSAGHSTPNKKPQSPLNNDHDDMILSTHTLPDPDSPSPPISLLQPNVNIIIKKYKSVKNNRTNKRDF